MTDVIASLSEISAPYDVLYCDLWGCLHNGKALFPQAVSALQTFRAKGGAVVLLTNAPRTKHAVKRRLDQMGLPEDAYDAIAASGDATQIAMLQGAAGRKLWHLGPGKDEDLFSIIPDWLQDQPAIERVPFEEAEGIICTGPFDEFNDTPEDYRGRFLAAKTRGLKMLCANPDLVVDLGEQRIICAGALAQLYEEMGGEVLSFGKPHPPVYDVARNALAAKGITYENDAILAIGDGIRTDLRGAQGEGIDALFVTGGLEADRFGPDVEYPDPALLTAWLKAEDLHPRYTIGRLR
ncbi:TIGR01459 family HAD-type hydrolase [Pararhodobacter zhoushanensis]|uniref:TIGR01459 family HAD-type hydrolase n=1 Tax=Pararhodobacter zhoushanensis TaxID=2479545 RepID=A0ABT3H127_9RHOB|nr:TIGR01459 family HAD-type hydrolase [Pararhodobacter zhoushanensis]MCW1933507.1 TIGR01459 family HAD-type hydrolase [Pararhodobacter zhoushanensis]